MRFITPFRVIFKQAALYALLLCTLLINIESAYAQQSVLSCSMDNIPMTNNPASGTDNSVLDGFTVDPTSTGASTWLLGPGRVIDNNLGNTFNGVIATTGSLSLDVMSTNGQYNAGNFVGFRLSSLSLSALGSITISTLDASGNPIAGESRSGASLLALSVGGASEVGFYTNKPFYGVRLHISVGIGVGTYSVYYAFMRGTGSCNNPAINNCNTAVTLAFPQHPVVAENSTSAVLAIGGITDLENMVDASSSTAATMVPVLNVLGSVGVSVKNTVGEYPAGTYIGFDIENSNIISVGVLNRYSIELYNNDGAVLQTINGLAALAGVNVLGGGNNRFTFGGASNVAFDEARLVFNADGLGANVTLGSTKIYQVIVKKLCDLRSSDCSNSFSSLNTALDPVYINWERTGVSGVLGVNNNISGLDNLIDGNVGTAATIVSLANAASNVSVGIKKTGTKYPAGTYVAFDIESKSI